MIERAAQAGSQRSTRSLRGISKDIRPLVVRCERAGGEVITTGSGHLAWTCPDGFEFSSSSTTGSGREPVRIRAKLRKHGVKV